MIRRIKETDIPRLMVFLEKALIEELEAIPFSHEWLSDGLYQLSQDKNAIVLIQDEDGINGLLIASLKYFMFTGEKTAECHFMCSIDSGDALLKEFEAWGKKMRATKTSIVLFGGQKIGDLSYKKIASIYVREENGMA